MADLERHEKDPDHETVIKRMHCLILAHALYFFFLGFVAFQHHVFFFYVNILPESSWTKDSVV